MKHQILVFSTVALMLCLLMAGGAQSETAPGYTFFPEISYRLFSCDAPGGIETFSAVFYTDGYFQGYGDDLAGMDGYYAILPDGTLLLDDRSAVYQLNLDETGSYTGAPVQGKGVCTLKTVMKQAFDAFVAEYDVDIDVGFDRTDLTHYDCLMYGIVTAPEGIDLIVNPTWTGMIATHVPAGMRVVMLGCTNGYFSDNEPQLEWIEYNGMRGFADADGVEYEPPRYARVVRASSKDKGKSVNLRSMPDYGDNVICEVPYGDIVTVYPVTQGEFTQVRYDDEQAEGWMTTVRLQLVEDD